eukprot:1462430-Rhodomonas_salina.1
MLQRVSVPRDGGAGGALALSLAANARSHRTNAPSSPLPAHHHHGHDLCSLSAAWEADAERSGLAPRLAGD